MLILKNHTRSEKKELCELLGMSFNLPVNLKVSFRGDKCT